MARVRATQKTSGTSSQLSLPFEPVEKPDVEAHPEKPSKSPERNEASVLQTVEAAGITRLDEATDRTPNAFSDGNLEHRYLVHRADRYEDRLFKAVVAYLCACGLVVVLKAGLPIAQALLHRYDLPPLDERLLTGFFGAAAFILGGVILYCLARVRQYTPQYDLKLVGRTWEFNVAQTLGFAWAALLAAVFVLVIYLSLRDIVYMVWYLFENIVYTLRGWDPDVRRSLLPSM
jgi:hypothetical protein